jgi:antitoxin (DNA-binding transcriptional repressor) of toxin-antitoxin stability system
MTRMVTDSEVTQRTRAIARIQPAHAHSACLQAPALEGTMLMGTDSEVTRHARATARIQSALSLHA